MFSGKFGGLSAFDPRDKRGSESKAPPSILAEGLVVIGTLMGDGEIQVNSCIEGEIRGRTIVVGESGSVRGEIGGETVKVRGSVFGNILARKVVLEGTSRVEGTIGQKSLSIRLGAYFHGRCHNFDRGRLALNAPQDPAPAPEPVQILAPDAPAPGGKHTPRVRPKSPPVKHKPHF